MNVRRHKIRYHGKKCILLSLRDVSSSMRLDQETHNNKMLKMLQSAVSRDLMTPLSCIAIFVDLCMNRTDIPPKEKLNILKQIKAQARFVQFKMHDLLDLTLLDNGQISKKNDHFIVHNVLNEVIQLVLF